MKKSFQFGLLVSIAALLLTACGGTENREAVSCEIVSLEQGAVVSDALTVTVAITGAISRVELLADGSMVAQQDVPEGQMDLELTWQTSEGADGAIDLVARAVLDDDREARSASIQVVVDNTPPRLAFAENFPRMKVIDGVAMVNLAVDEPNPVSCRVVHEESGRELLNSAQIGGGFGWDTSADEDGIHHLMLEVTDEAGHTARLNHYPVVIANHGEEIAFEFIGNSNVIITENWMNEEYHLRASADSQTGITRVISWLSWEATPDWSLGYDIGQGLCPHRGISYISQESDSGEIVIDLRRADLPEDITSRFPAEDLNTDTFPDNGDRLTFGAFFGHVAPMDPASHVGETLPIQIHFVFFHTD